MHVFCSLFPRNSVNFHVVYLCKMQYNNQVSFSWQLSFFFLFHTFGHKGQKSLSMYVPGPYAPQGSQKLPKWSRCSKSVLQTLIRTSEVYYSRSIGEVSSNRVTSSLLRKWTRLPTHACKVGALTFKVTDNYGSNGVVPCGAYGPWQGRQHQYELFSPRKGKTQTQALTHLWW